MFIKKCIALIAITLITLPAIAQEALHGGVVDSSTNLPLEGVTVTLLPSKISTITNAGGVFIFKKNIASETAISFSEIGYAEKNFQLMK